FLVVGRPRQRPLWIQRRRRGIRGFVRGPGHHGLPPYGRVVGRLKWLRGNVTVGATNRASEKCEKCEIWGRPARPRRTVSRSLHFATNGVPGGKTHVVDRALRRRVPAVTPAARAGARPLPRRRHPRPAPPGAVPRLPRPRPGRPQVGRGRPRADRLLGRPRGAAAGPRPPGGRRGGAAAEGARHTSGWLPRRRGRVGPLGAAARAVGTARPLRLVWHRGDAHGAAPRKTLHRPAGRPQVRGALPRLARLPRPPGRRALRR